MNLRAGCSCRAFRTARARPVRGLGSVAHRPVGGAFVSSYAQRIKAYAQAHPEAEVLGGGWAMDVFPGGTPTCRRLDAIVPGRPAFINNRDNHGAWLRALEMAGVTRATADPPDGRFERDEHGTPTGTLHEGAMDVVRRLIPAPTTDEIVDGIRGAGPMAFARHHRLAGRHRRRVQHVADSFDAYLVVAGDGRLSARVVGALWWERARGGAGGRPDRATLSGEGRPFSRHEREDHAGRRLREPNRRDDDPVPCRGRAAGRDRDQLQDPETLRGSVRRLDAEGFQVHIHAIGDRASAKRSMRSSRPAPATG